MKFENLIQLASPLAFFDLSLIAQLSGENKRQVTLQLHRLMQDGKVLALRRGLYTLAESFRKSRLCLPALANEIYKPSYLSTLWALSYYGIIPEKVVTFTSVTTRVTRDFKNPLGQFAYSSLKTDFFWGCNALAMDGATVWLADREKALLDYWHLNSGEWTVDRLLEMRFQNTETLNLKKLTRFAQKWNSPRLIRATQELHRIVVADQKGYRKI